MDSIILLWNQPWVWIIWILYGILEKFMSSQPRVLLGFHINPKIMESKVGKTSNSTIRTWNTLFEDGFIV